MQRIYYAIVLLVLYGDLVKRVLSPSAALFVLYAMALAILFAIARRKRAYAPRMSREGRMLHIAVMSLVLLYLSQLLTSPPDYFIDAISHALYMIIPLMYILVLQRRLPEFDLVGLGKVFLFFMIPINLIGLAQYYVDPTFFISTAYDKDSGGVIVRNFLGAGTFNRYPSLFASADRYSAMGLMQLYFTVIVFMSTHSNSNREKLWLIINALSAVVALFIAGARSRILIAIVAAVAAALTSFIKLHFSGKLTLARATVPVGSVLLLGVLTIWLIAPHESSGAKSGEDLFPVITMLAQTLEEGDISTRIGEATEFSLLPEEITVFGQGLGTVSKGKPGEFGIRSIWIESGMFWGGMMLVAFLTIVAALALRVWRSFLALKPLNMAIYMVPFLLLIFALLAGLTSSFELSTGLMLGCSIAIILRRRRGNTVWIRKSQSFQRVAR